MCRGDRGRKDHSSSVHSATLDCERSEQEHTAAASGAAVGKAAAVDRAAAVGRAPVGRTALVDPS